MSRPGDAPETAPDRAEGGYPNPVVRRLESMPLTWRIVAILLVLLVSAMSLTALTTAYLLKRDLVSNTDQQLRIAAKPVAAEVLGIQRDRTGPPSNYAFVYIPTDGSEMTLINPTGETLRPNMPRLAVDDPRVATGQPFTVGSANGDMAWRFVAGKVSDGSATFAIGVPMRGPNRTVQRLLVVIGTIGMGVIAASAALGWAATQRAVRPLRRIEDVAAAIAHGDLTRRVPVRTSRDEVASLSESLNVMLGQIERSFTIQEASEAKMRQFVADASHELRTPLATVQGYAELYRQGAIQGDEAVGASMDRIESEARRMSILVEDLLLLARLDDERPLERQELDLVVLGAEAVHDARARDPERPISIRGLSGELEPVWTKGDDARLRQVLNNLLANALMHTDAGVAVEVAVGTLDDRAVIEIRDHGDGLDPEAARRVFERFFRADKARSRARGGSGLGLAIVAAIVHQHDGEVEVRETEGGGATFRVTLPGTTPPD